MKYLSAAIALFHAAALARAADKQSMRPNEWKLWKGGEKFSAPKTDGHLRSSHPVDDKTGERRLVNPSRNVYNTVPETKKDGNTLFKDDGGDVTPNIVDGDPAERLEYKFFVSMGGCGASLVAPNVVLCAAHCRGVADTVSLGMHNIQVASGDPAGYLQDVEHIPIKTEVRHPNYNSNTLDNDFWVIELEWNTQMYADQVVALDNGSIPLPLSSPTATPLTVIGFGTLSSGGSSPNTLMKVEVDYIDNDACMNQYSYSDGEITSTMLCAANPGKDSCQGDSGGPIFYSSGGTFTQVGIVSWGYGCADSRYPGVYSRVSAGYDWIDGYITTWYRNNPNAQPPALSTGDCIDEPTGWYDRDGPNYNCMWYGSSNKNCRRHGDSFPNGGMTANQVCCACGGGATVVGGTNAPTTSPSKAPTRAPVVPTNPPTSTPSKSPTGAPTGPPVVTTPSPTSAPSSSPTSAPTGSPVNCGGAKFAPMSVSCPSSGLVSTDVCCSGQCFASGGNRNKCK